MNRVERRGRPRRRWRDEATIALALAAFAAAVALSGWAWRLDRLAYDLGLFLWTRPPPPGIVIVAIDDASVEAIGRWPWRRAVHASLLERLALARPKAVALDLVLSEPDPDPEQDRLLTVALQRAAPVVLPVAWASLGPGAQGQALAGGTLQPLVALEPAGTLRQAVRLGSAESAVDADGVLRHAFLKSGPPHARRLHLALALLEAGGETLSPRAIAEAGTDEDGGGLANAASGDSANPQPARWQRDGRFLIRYAGPPGTVERVSYVDVLSGAVPPERLAGRYLLVGMTAHGLGDTLATPVNGWHQAMPGIEVLANTLYTLRSGDVIHAVDDATVAALSAAGLVLLLVSFGRFGPRTAMPTAVASLPLAVGASLLALRSGLWFSPVPFTLAAGLAYPLWSWRRLERAVAGLDQEIGRLDAEWLVARADARAVRPVGGDAIDMRLQTLRRAGRLVRQARGFLADSLAAMPTAMLVADDHMRVVLANPKAAALFDVDTVDELHHLDLVRLLAELSTPQHFDGPGALAKLVAGGEGLAVEGRLAEKGDFVVHVAAVDLQGQRSLIVTIADVEPVKQAQREREEALAFVSHDLRSPASSIVLLADLNLDGHAHTPRDELLREMRRLAARTLELSEDFVRAAQAQSQPLQRSPQLACALLEEALADVRAQAQAADVPLNTLAQDPASTDVAAVRVSVDRLLVVRAIVNLISNAIKQSPRGSAVELQLLARGTALLLSVRDHGPGLSPEQMAQIARGNEGVAVQDARGVGLGLLFVQRVAYRHGGVLRAGPPSQGGGAVFELELPL